MFIWIAQSWQLLHLAHAGWCRVLAPHATSHTRTPCNPLPTPQKPDDAALQQLVQPVGEQMMAAGDLASGPRRCGCVCLPAARGGGSVCLPWVPAHFCRLRSRCCPMGANICLRYVTLLPHTAAVARSPYQHHFKLVSEAMQALSWVVYTGPNCGGWAWLCPCCCAWAGALCLPPCMPARLAEERQQPASRYAAEFLWLLAAQLRLVALPCCRHPAAGAACGGRSLCRRLLRQQGAQVALDPLCATPAACLHSAGLCSNVRLCACLAAMPLHACQASGAAPCCEAIVWECRFAIFKRRCWWSGGPRIRTTSHGWRPSKSCCKASRYAVAANPLGCFARPSLWQFVYCVRYLPVILGVLF